MSKKCLEFDPNFTYSEDQEMEDEEDAEGWGDDGYDDQIDVGDDDTAWKVRKAALRVIEGTILSCPM